jgi:hypothetical protein
MNIMMKKKTMIWAVFLILLYSILNIIILIHHEPCGDEAQAWLIARDLDIGSIFRQMNYEGSPALWHILLLPLAKTGLPYISESILHLIIAVSAVVVFIQYAPFSKITKLLFIFSYYMAYEYSIIARSYSLSILLLFVIAALYNKRFKYALWYSFLIFLLFNTNVHSFFIATSLTIVFAWELYRYKVKVNFAKISVFVMFMGGVLSFLQLLPQPDNMNYGIFTRIEILAPIVAIANAFYPWIIDFFIPTNLRLIFMGFSFLIFFTVVLSLYKTPAVLFILSLSLSGLFYIFVFKYLGALRHHGLILIMLFFALWISTYYNNSQKIISHMPSNINIPKISILLINICLTMSLLYSLKTQYLEYQYIFSGAKEMSDFIRRNKLYDYNIIAHPSQPASALLPYLPEKSFWYADIKDYGTFITYNTNYLIGSNISDSEVIARMRKVFSEQSTILLLLTAPLDSHELHNFRLFYKVDKVLYGREKYYLYKSVSEDL